MHQDGHGRNILLKRAFIGGDSYFSINFKNNFVDSSAKNKVYY